MYQFETIKPQLNDVDSFWAVNLGFVDFPILSY